MEENVMVFSERLKEARKQKGLTQQHLADSVNIKKTTISNYETGYSTPSNKMIVDLANILGVTTDFLLGRVNSPMGDKYEPGCAKPSDTHQLYEDLEKLNPADIMLLKSLIQWMHSKNENRSS